MEKTSMPTVPIRRCTGCSRSLPLRWTFEGLRRVREAIEADSLPDDAVLATYRCPKCKTISQLTASDLYLGESGMVAEPA